MSLIQIITDREEIERILTNASREGMTPKDEMEWNKWRHAWLYAFGLKKILVICMPHDYEKVVSRGAKGKFNGNGTHYILPLNSCGDKLKHWDGEPEKLSSQPVFRIGLPECANSNDQGLGKKEKKSEESTPTRRQWKRPAIIVDKKGASDDITS